MSYHCGGRGLVWVLLVPLLSPPEGRAQGVDADGARREVTTAPLLPPDHWAVRAATRLQAMGLAQAYLPAQSHVPRDAVLRALTEAEARLDEDHPLRDLVSAWTTRFHEEAGDGLDRAGAPGFSGMVAAGYATRSSLHSGAGEVAGRLPLRDSMRARGWTANASAALLLHPALLVTVAPAWERDEEALQRWSAVARLGAVSVSVGREAIGYSASRAGGIVLGATEPLERLEVQTVLPVRLPGPLGFIGQVAAHTFLSRLGNDEGHPERPFLWGLSLTAQPIPRLIVAVHQASLFGGDHLPTPVNAGTILRVISGKTSGRIDFENRVGSLEMRYRLPVDRWIPVLLSFEWGADTPGGGFEEAPGVNVGLAFPVLPGFPEGAAGVEYSWLGERCCFADPMRWYRKGHLFFGTADEPLGHPLGGNGSQWLVYSSADLADARLRARGTLFLRDRAATTLYGSQRAGRSRGGTLTVLWRVSPDADLHVVLEGERGAQWSEHDLRAGLRLFF